MHILGIGDVFHDASLCLMQDTSILGLIEEERITRVKHGVFLPEEDYTLEKHGASIASFIKNNPRKDREDKFAYLLNLLTDKTIDNIELIVSSTLYEEPPYQEKAIQIDHHLAHAASTYYPSCFANAAILIVDGNGKQDEQGVYPSVCYAYGDGAELSQLGTVSGKIQTKQGAQPTVIALDNSVGSFYRNITLLLGLHDFAEGKTMALAAYGDKKQFYSAFAPYITLLDQGQCTINNLALFELVEHLISQHRHLQDSALFQFRANIAAAAQAHLEELLLHFCHRLYTVTKATSLCLAGGVALNTVANSNLLKKTPFERLFIQPAAGDNGISLGCALYGAYALQKLERKTEQRFSPYLGLSYSQSAVDKALANQGDKIIEELSIVDVCQYAAEQLSENKIIAWFNGASEIGPRALGNRSILANPTMLKTKEYLNNVVKKREAFRPFAPVVMAEYASDYFNEAYFSPYMLLNFEVKPEVIELIPAVLHVDNTARIQTILEEDNPDYYRLIRAFHKMTGVPILLNTSFNGNEEPVVESPFDALQTFLALPIDILIINKRVLFKNTRNSN